MRALSRTQLPHVTSGLPSIPIISPSGPGTKKGASFAFRPLPPPQTHLLQFVTSSVSILTKLCLQQYQPQPPCPESSLLPFLERQNDHLTTCYSPSPMLSPGTQQQAEVDAFPPSRNPWSTAGRWRSARDPFPNPQRDAITLRRAGRRWGECQGASLRL